MNVEHRAALLDLGKHHFQTQQFYETSRPPEMTKSLALYSQSIASYLFPLSIFFAYLLHPNFISVKKKFGHLVTLFLPRFLRSHQDLNTLQALYFDDL